MAFFAEFKSKINDVLFDLYLEANYRFTGDSRGILCTQAL